MAALLQLGKWFDMLRAEDSYDNCRIVIVSDHGSNLNQIDAMRFGQARTEDAMYYNPLLLVKDFNSHDFTVDERLMTNADTPVLALKGLIEDPVNPFTGNSISDRAKYADELHVYASHETEISGTLTTFPKDSWYSVNGDVRNGNNWHYLGEW